MTKRKHISLSNNESIKAVYQLLSKIARFLGNSPKILFNKKIIQQTNQNIVQLINKITKLGSHKSTSRNQKQIDGIIQEVDKLDFHLAIIADMKVLPQKIIRSLIKQCRQIIKSLSKKE